MTFQIFKNTISLTSEQKKHRPKLEGAQSRVLGTPNPKIKAQYS